MYVINRDDLNDTDRDVQSETWRDRRMVLGREGVGFSFPRHRHLRRHALDVPLPEPHRSRVLRAGRGTLTDEETGKTYPLSDGTMYLLDGHEKHTVVANTELRMACVFNPPVTGREVHDENGVYPLIIEETAAV